MIRDIRSYCSCNNKTIRLATRNRYRYNIYNMSNDYRYKNLRDVSTCGRALHYVGGTLNNDCMGYYFTYNAKITLHDIAD